jgi:hypothetical protein
MPGVQTMQGLLAYCAAPAPYPFLEGQTEKNSRRAKEDVVRIKGREFSPDLKIDTINNPTLARILVSYQKQMEIKEGELVEAIRVRRNKNRTYVECRFISPEQNFTWQGGVDLADGRYSLGWATTSRLSAYHRLP